MRNVVVTGASTGIGAACALRMDRLGWRVFAGVRKEADGERLRERASERLTPVRIDVVDAETIARAAETVAAAVGEEGVHGLVNNAGIAVSGPLEFLAIKDLRRQLDVNVIGLMAVTQAFLPQLRVARGRIVNMSSVSGLVAAPMVGAYAASKFALEALSDVLRVELRPWGMHVALVEPGPIATPIWEKSRQEGRAARDAMPAACREYYGAVMTKMGALVGEIERDALPADAVADKVEHALTAARPKTRYLVGKHVRLQMAIVSMMPTRLCDWVFAKKLNG